MKFKNVWHSKFSTHYHIGEEWLCARYWAETESSLIVLHFTAEFSVGCFSPVKRENSKTGHVTLDMFHLFGMLLY